MAATRPWSPRLPVLVSLPALEEDVIGDEDVEDLPDDDLVEAAAPSQPRVAPPPLPVSARDPFGAVFAAGEDVERDRSVLRAAQTIASVLGDVFGARAVIVYRHHLGNEELHAIAAHGSAVLELLEPRSATVVDAVTRTVLEDRKPGAMRFDDTPRHLVAPRLRTLDARRSLLAVPVVAWGRCVAIIEVVDADETMAYALVEAAAHLARCFGLRLTSSASEARTASAART